MPASRVTRPPRVVRVAEIEQLSAGLVRIVFTGDDLLGFQAGQFTDHYVKLHFPPPGAPYGPPFDPAELRSSAPRELWPRTRTYTVRRWDPEGLRLTIDFVVHGDGGVAGAWAAHAQPGDLLQLVGPGGAYLPDPAVAMHLLVGDESAIPAIAAALERMPGSGNVAAIVQLPDERHEVPLASAAELTLVWVHGEDQSAVLDRLRELALRPPFQAFVHGEAELVRSVRRYLLVDLQLPREMLSASGYWKRDRTEDGWRDDKAEWNRLAEADLAAAPGPPGA